MNFLITGGTGFIGRTLVAELLKAKHQVSVLTRNRNKARGLLGKKVTLFQDLTEISEDTKFDWVINLAGAGVADRPWTQSRKNELLESRILFTERLVNCLDNLKAPPGHMISASAVGFYGDRDGAVCNEKAKKGTGFTADLCADWEEAAKKYQLNVEDRRVYIIRLGVVLDLYGGLLQRLRPVYRLGMGTIFGSGKQNFPWVHLGDVIPAIQFLVKSKPKYGVYNLVAPSLVTQRQFAKSISYQLNRPLWLRVPSAVLRLLLRDQAALFLDDATVVPEVLQELGFGYRHSDLSTIIG